MNEVPCEACAACSPSDRLRARAMIESLRPRQRQVFDRVVVGRSSAAIAKEFSISTKTVETHRGKIHKKFGTHDMASMVRLAATAGLLLSIMAEHGLHGSSATELEPDPRQLSIPQELSPTASTLPVCAPASTLLDSAILITSDPADHVEDMRPGIEQYDP
jgi:DNA-binding CsgD family transcriptional regulator